MNQNTPVIQFKNVSLTFTRDLNKYKIHEDLNFEIFAGESVTILGPSGTGKTLILKMILGLIQPTSGKVFVLGKDLSLLNDFELTHLRLKLGMLFQGAALFDSLNVFNNVAYSLHERKEKSETEIIEIVSEKLAIVGLSGTEDKFPSELSGGQKKRIALARALASTPEIMLYDEPTTGLDPTSTRLIDDLIITLNTQLKITSIAVTHDIASSERFSTRWILISNGKVVADGSIENLMKNSEDVRNFVHGNWRS